MDCYNKLRPLFYYKLRQVLQSAMDFLQKRQVLQSAMIITNCDSTRGHTTTNFPPSFWTWIKSLRIQLQEKSPAFDILSGSKETRLSLKERKFIFYRRFYCRRRRRFLRSLTSWSTAFKVRPEIFCSSLSLANCMEVKMELWKFAFLQSSLSYPAFCSKYVDSHIPVSF